MKKWLAAVAVVVTGATSQLQAEIREQTVTYPVEGVELVGQLVWDDAIAGERPGVLVVHEWWGLNDYARKRARQLADLGYAALAVDMYGDGRNTDHPREATAFMQAATATEGLAERRFRAAKSVLQQQPMVDDQRIAAIGYCFGGKVVLDMVRNGVELDLVASFHGLLETSQPAQPGVSEARVLVFNGADDPMVKPESLRTFAAEMQNAGISHRIQNYTGATHGFTNPDADRLGREHDMPLAYNLAADVDSWNKLREEMKKVFDQRATSGQPAGY
jgi:dienelactone hydrolase